MQFLLQEGLFFTDLIYYQKSFSINYAFVLTKNCIPSANSTSICLDYLLLARRKNYALFPTNILIRAFILFAPIHKSYVRGSYLSRLLSFVFNIPCFFNCIFFRLNIYQTFIFLIHIKKNIKLF